MPEVVFLMPWAPIGSDRERLGITALAGQFKVTVADLAPLLAPQHPAGTGADLRRIESYGDLAAFLHEKKDAVFCDYVLGRSSIGPKHARLFRELAKAKTKYFVVLAAELPFSEPSRAGFWEKAAARLCAARGLARYALELVVKKPVAALRKKGFYARPARIYALNRKSAEGFATSCGLGPEVVRPVNSIDYGAFLAARSRGLLVSAGPTCVLIDEGIADSRDFEYAGLKGLTAEEYYPALNSFLDKVERELGLTVVVAAHPKADPEERRKLYGGRQTVHGRTLEAVAGASLVLAHWSTAVNFAVLCGKPLLLLKSGPMEQKGLARLADTMGQALGARVLKIEDALAAPLDIEPGQLPMTGYREYLARYIKSPEAPEVNMPEAIIADLKADWPAGIKEVQSV